MRIFSCEGAQVYFEFPTNSNFSLRQKNVVENNKAPGIHGINEVCRLRKGFKTRLEESKSQTTGTDISCEKPFSADMEVFVPIKKEILKTLLVTEAYEPDNSFVPRDNQAIKRSFLAF